MTKKPAPAKKLITHTLYIQGIHCPACEIIIADTLAESQLIDKFFLSTKENKVLISFKKAELADEKLALFLVQKMFAGLDYVFTLTPVKTFDWLNALVGIGLAAAILGVVSLLNQQNLIAEPKLDTSSGYLAFFVFGLLASISSCAVLIGGIVLAFTKTWFKEGVVSKWPVIASFQAGRILGFATGGLLLGLVGSLFKINPLVNIVLLIVVSILMILAGLDFMGLKIWSFFKIKRKSLFKLSSSQPLSPKLKGPLVVGAATFLVPCGFTSTVQLIALTTQSPWRAILVLISFVLGTVPVLSLIAYSGSLWRGEKRSNQIISYAVGVLVIALGLMNLNWQFRALGWPSYEGQSIWSEGKTGTKTVQTGLVAMEDEVQVIRLTADARGYKPTKVMIRANTPTRLEIDDIGTRGCTNAIIAPDFFEGEIPLTNGETAVKEFMAPDPGKYKITCWMKMVTVNVEVV